MLKRTPMFRLLLTALIAALMLSACAAPAAEEPSAPSAEATETPAAPTEAPDEPTEAPAKPTEAPAEAEGELPRTSVGNVILAGLTGDERNEAAWAKNEEALIEYAPVRTTLASGVQVQTIPFDNCVWNIGVLKADQRGCQSCHSIEDAVQNLPMSHPELWHPYNVEMDVNYCYMCHNAVRNMADALHALHLGNKVFEDSFNGSCESCHYINSATNEMQLWDRVKYDVLSGFTDVSNIQGEFTYDQNVLTEDENLFWFWNNGDGRGIQPNYIEPEEDVNQEMFNNWTIEIKGCVDEPVTVTLAQLIEECQSVTKIMKINCQVNQPAGPCILNCEVTGIPFSEIFKRLEIDPEANGLTTVGDDGWPRSLPMSWLKDHMDECLLVYKFNGEYLPARVGYPCQTWIPYRPANTSIKRPVSMEFTCTATEPKMQDGVVDYVTGVHWNKPNSCIYYTVNGQFFKLGEPITLEGYADGFDEKIVKIEFSLDRGKTWTAYDTSDTDAMRWVYWHYTFQPEATGSYVIKVRATTETGMVQYVPATLMFNVE